MNRWYTEGFVNGVYVYGKQTTYLEDVFLGDGSGKTLDYGVDATFYENLKINSLTGVDLVSSQGQAGGSHTFYSTGGTTTYPSYGLSIGQITSRNNEDAKFTVSLKHTEDFVIGAINGPSKKRS